VRLIRRKDEEMLKLKVNGLFDDNGNNILNTIKPGDVHPCISTGRKKDDTRELKVQCTRRTGNEIALRLYLPKEKVDDIPHKWRAKKGKGRALTFAKDIT
jgi:hypothetical protein